MSLMLHRAGLLRASAGGVEPTVPDAFEVGDWSIAPGDEEADVTINALPDDGGAAITDIEYRLDGGSWVSSGGTTSFTITGLTNDEEYDVELRGVNSVGAGDWSDTKQVTPEGEAPEWSAEAQQFFDRATLTDPDKEIWAAFIDGLISDGIWSKFDVLLVLAGETAAIAETNIKAAGLTISKFNTPTFTSYRGYAGNGSNQHLQLSWAASDGVQYAQNNAHWSYYVRTSPGAAVSRAGGVDASTEFAPDFFGSTRIGINAGADGWSSGGVSTGHFIAVRTASNATAGFRGAASLGTGSFDSASRSSLKIPLLAMYSGSETASQFWAGQLSLVTFGAALDGTEHTAFRSRVTALLTAVGAL